MTSTGSMARRVLTAAALAALGAGLATQAALGSDTAGKTTLEQTLEKQGAGDFKTIGLGAGETPHIVRELGGATAGATRAADRSSLLYFAQLSDFQTVDEESPARVEFLDPTANGPIPFEGAWRPHEAFTTQVAEMAIRQVNEFAAASPVTDGNDDRAEMAFALTTGDSADNQHKNETEWVVSLLDGGSVVPNSGDTVCPGVDPGEALPGKYTGVQDYDDYFESPHHYDPDSPIGIYKNWPQWPGLMDRAQDGFTADGLDVPSYVVFGNHDALAQGNQAALAPFEAVGTGCAKIMGPVFDPRELSELDESYLIDALSGQAGGEAVPVPADEDRQYVSKRQYKALHDTGDAENPDAHGFALQEPAVRRASRDAAGYYEWSPEPGFRFIALDSVSEGGVAGPGALGNIDDPQFSWVERKLRQATRRNELVVVFSHHPIRSMLSPLPDETAPPCAFAPIVGPIHDAHGHDANPGCDLDPRVSTPIHLGDDISTHVEDLIGAPEGPDVEDAEPVVGESMKSLLLRYPNVIAWVAGHTHDNKVTAYETADDSSGFWMVETAAEIDWPQQSRLIEVMDNDDDTLSIFGTVLDHSSPSAVPASGSAAGAFDLETLGAIGRAISANDPQASAAAAGDPQDRNVELVLPDPR